LAKQNQKRIWSSTSHHQHSYSIHVKVDWLASSDDAIPKIFLCYF